VFGITLKSFKKNININRELGERNILKLEDGRAT
jgi:hypothetical protein